MLGVSDAKNRSFQAIKMAVDRNQQQGILTTFKTGCESIKHWESLKLSNEKGSQ